MSRAHLTAGSLSMSSHPVQTRAESIVPSIGMPLSAWGTGPLL
jgi:hypothetical protein